MHRRACRRSCGIVSGASVTGLLPRSWFLSPCASSLSTCPLILYPSPSLSILLTSTSCEPRARACANEQRQHVVGKR